MYYLDQRLQAGLAAPEPVASASAGIPGTCGELVQGRFEGRDVLLSCPIDRYVRARVQLVRDGLVTGLSDAPRTAAALSEVLRYHARDSVGVHVDLNSPLPRGKGMASSTADICTVAAAVLRAFGESPEPERLARLATAIEPSDGIMHPGLALMDRYTGTVLRHFPAPPPLTLLALDAGGEVETLGFHRPEHDQHRERQAGAFAEAVAAVQAGLESGCAEMLATGATQSARLNQSILPNPLLDPVERIGRQVGAHGVCIAHSGTLVGLLMPPEPDRVTFALARLRARFGSDMNVETFTPIGGGLVVRRE